MFYSYCPNCFSHTESSMCEYCGYNQADYKKPDGALPPNHILNARYLLGKVLGKGGFGITYLAKDLVTDNLVAVKECMPDSYSHRLEGYTLLNNPNDTSAFNHCKQNFKDEISALVKLRSNDFVVDVYDYFSQNNTEYFVMEYINGKSLKYLTYVQGGTTSLENAVLMFFTMGSALMEIHSHGIIHRDISPENIMFDADGNIKLIDFGACKNTSNPNSLNNESIFLKPGFAPPEQYEFDGNQGPWTDVYALAATFYTVVSGEPLIDSTYRLEDDSLKTLSELGCNVPQYVSDAIERGMSPYIETRYSSVAEFLNDMADFAYVADKIDQATTDLIRHKTALAPATKSASSRFEEHSFKNVKFPYVEIISGRHKGEKIKIPDYGFVCLGREAGTANLVVDDFAQISRAHCLVGYDRSKNRFIVIDKSHNGTYYDNNQRMLWNSHSFLQPDEHFYICSPELKVNVTLI